MTNAAKKHALKIGFSSMGRWMGGIAYLDILTKSLAELSDEERPAMTLVVNEPDGIDLHARIIERMQEVILVGPAFHGLAPVASPGLTIHKVGQIEQALVMLDTYFPVNSYVIPSKKAISWIPDFQHLYLPQLFSKEDCADRDRRYREIAEKASHVVFSSQDAAKDFARYNASQRTRVHVMPFYSLPEQDCYAATPEPVVQKYKLPQKFLICCNQFWQHKNHRTVFEAIKMLRRNGVHVPLVCTGALTDSRNPQYIEDLKRLLVDSGIRDLVYLLGELPRADQLQLMRASMAVVQPSLFEGWSTVVEDARAFGKTIFLSDLNVHKEQAPRWAIYFDRNSPGDLAEKIVLEAANLRMGPDKEREQFAREDAKKLTADFARNFLSIAYEASGVVGDLGSHAENVSVTVAER
jgi:glycosyltransferase involved in cell wall biosynthesis